MTMLDGMAGQGADDLAADDLAADDMAEVELAAPEMAAPDFASLDRRLQATFQVDRVTDYPELPDMVRYDLAASQQFRDEADMSGFLYGLQQDLRDVGLAEAGAPVRIGLAEGTYDYLAERGEQLSAVQETGGSNNQRFLEDESFYNDIRRGVAGIAGKGRPRVFSTDAVQSWENEVSRRGIVDPDEFEMGLPSARFKQANYELGMQQMGERFSGARFGAVPLRGTDYEDGSRIDGITDLFDQWLSPSGLISTAVAMDFLPDFGAIQREASGWGDKWRQWWDNPSSPRDFIDALTGPIDDIVFPIVNTALLFAGVGATWQAARIGTTAYRTGRAARMFTGTPGVSRSVAQAFGFGDDTIRAGLGVMEQSSMLSNRMARSGYRLATGTAGAMDKWRSYHSVQTAKMAVRGGMRLGLAGNVETLLLPNREGGVGLFGSRSGTKDMMEEARQWRFDPGTPQGAISMVAELAFQPSRLFLPGTVSSKVKGAARTVRRWDEYGRAKDLIGKQMSRTDYAFGKAGDEAYRRVARVAENRELEMARLSWWRQRHSEATNRALDELGDDAGLAAGNLLSDPDEIRDFGRQIRTDVGRQAAKERAGEIGTYMLTAAAIDHAATVRLAEMGLDRSNLHAYYKIRNSIESSLKPGRAQRLHDVNGETLQRLAVESADESLDAARRTAASEELERYSQELRVYADERLGYGWTDNPALEGLDVKSRLSKRADEIDEILDEFFDPATADEAFARMNAHIDEWGKRRQVSLDSVLEETPVENLVGYMDDIAIDNPEVFNRWDDFHDATFLIADDALDSSSVFAKKLPQHLDDADMRLVDVPDPYVTQWGTQLQDSLRKIRVPASSVGESLLNTYKGADNLDDGMLTVARLDSPVKQDVDRLYGMTRQLRRMKDWLVENPLPDNPRSLLDDLEDFDGSMSTFLRQDRFNEFGNATKQNRHALEALRWVSASGGDLDEPMKWIDDIQSDILRSDLVKRLRGVDPAKVRAADDSLDTLSKQLVEARKFTAAEMAFDQKNPAARAIEASLAEKGYKLVRGKQFLALQDTMGLRGPHAALSQAHMDRVTLGRFFQKIPESEKMVQRRRRLFADLKSRTGWSDAKVEDSIQALESAVRAGRDDLEAVAEHDAAGFVRKTADRIRQAKSPRSIFDYNLRTPDIQNFLKVSPQEAAEIHTALIKARQLGFGTNGLQEIENVLMAKPWLRSTLGMFDSAGLGDDAMKRSLWRAAFAGDTKVKSGWESFYKAKLAASTAGGAVVGGAIADHNGGDWRQGALAGALGGAGVGLSPKVATALTRNASTEVARAGRTFNPLSMRTFARAAVGAGAGGLVAGGFDREDWEDNPWAVGAALFGALAAPGMLRGLGKAYDVGNAQLWERTGGRFGGRDYSRLTERALSTRDFLRFTINPWFDAQRYSEGLIMGATRDWGDDITIPLNYTPTRTRKLITKGKVDVDEIGRQIGRPLSKDDPKQVERLVGEALKEATGGKLDPDLMEATTRRFTDLGILGFSNHRWQTSAATHLMSQGVDLQSAANMVQDLYSYGKAGRSAAELSANFVFFPFSYMKKLTTQLAKFGTDDLSRAILVTDALRAYDWLDEQYDLQRHFDAYAPILSELRVLNPLGMGLSPGQLGGINAPILDVAYGSIVGDAARDVANLFLPQAVMLEDPDKHSQLEDAVMRAIPALNSARRMLEDSLPDQVNVFVSPRHVSKTEEINRGMAEVNRLRQQFAERAEAEGFTMAQMMRSRVGSFRGNKARLKDAYRAAETDILDRYPALAKARQEWTSKRYQRNAELAAITNRPNPTGLSPAETAVWVFSPMVDEFEQRMAAEGLDIDIDGEDFYPPEEENSIRAVAIALAGDSPEFEVYYKQYWEPQFGPISREV